MDKKETPENTPVIQKEKEITVQVLGKINAFVEAGELVLPSDYSAANALKGAMLALQDVKDRSGKLALEVCTKNSIAQALLKMAVQGLSVVKNQGYFIPYGDQLTWSRSYQGSLALAKRVGGVKDVVASVIYDGDDFEFSIDIETGYKKLVKHGQKLENIDNSKIRGAYAVVLYEDGHKDLEVMTIQEIKTAWNQGASKGNSPAHQNFTQEMCKKTVINRACKTPINSSNDANLFTEDEPVNNLTEVKKEVVSESVAQTVEFEEVHDDKSTPKPEETKSEPETIFEPQTTQQKEIKSFSEKLNADNPEEKSGTIEPLFD